MRIAPTAATKTHVVNEIVDNKPKTPTLKCAGVLCEKIER